MKAPKFTHLVVKPTLSCTANCKICHNRRMLHKMKRKEDLLTNGDWSRLFQEVNELGTHHLVVSGGEPTLYKGIVELIEEGAKYGWEIGMNTNGSLIDEELALQLVDAGLAYVKISVYSSEPELHDAIRNHKGLWKKAVNALKVFVNIRERRNPNFKVEMQTLVCKDNYTKFHHLIQLAYDLRVCNLTFSYLEGDYKEKKYLLDESQIMAFKEEIIPLTIEVISNSSADKRAKETMISAVKAFYSLEKNSLANYASGIYQAPVPCSRPGYFSIILANGDVHPCNMVEYTHHPVMGNLHEKRFSEMWQGKEWENFRKNGFDMCQYCPMPLSLTIPVMRAPNFPGIRTLFDNSLLKKAKPHIFKMLIKHRKIFKKMGLYPN